MSSTQYWNGLAVGVGCLALTMAAGCGGSSGGGTAQTSAFALRFVATDDGRPVGCTDTLSGLGPDGTHQAGISDLRFYVSNLVFRDADGDPVDLSLDENEFQLEMDSGDVGLIDLTSNTEGTCAGNSIAFAEGTARTHTAITGRTEVERVASVSFDVGVPQAVMREVIADNTIEGAPSPLGEMYWSWASGYRHFVVNLAVTTTDGETGDGYLHVGSRDCGPQGGLALSDRDACDFVNTPEVEIDDFSLASDEIQVDLRQVLQGMDFVSPIYDLETFEIIGEGPGVECHSAPPEFQPDCASLFASFGLLTADGSASASGNHVFSKR